MIGLRTQLETTHGQYIVQHTFPGEVFFFIQDFNGDDCKI